MITRKKKLPEPQVIKEEPKLDLPKVDPTFVHLHVHDDYSLLDGFSACDEYVDKIIEDNVKFTEKTSLNRREFFCITNHGLLSQIPTQFQCCKQDSVEINPIYGLEVNINDNRHLDSSILEDKEEEKQRIEKVCNNNAIVILAKTSLGLKKLIKISSDSWINGNYITPRIDHKTLYEIYNSDDLIFCNFPYNSTINRNIISGDFVEAEKWVLEYKDKFKDFYLGISLVDLKEQHEINTWNLKFSQKYNIPIVLSNNVHYCVKNDAPSQRIFLLLQNKTTLRDYDEDEEIYHFHPNELWYKTEEELDEIYKAKFSYIPEEIYQLSKQNTVIVAKQCQAKLDTSSKIPVYLGDMEGLDSAEYLKKLAYEGLKRLGKDQNQEYIDRIETELAVIKRQNFSDYFLLVREMVMYAKENGVIVGCGRGCFVPGTKILLGFKNKKNIEDIKVGDKIQNFYHKYANVLEKFEYDVDEELIELEFVNKQKITCTKDHEFLTQRGMVKAIDLTKDDDIQKINTYEKLGSSYNRKSFANVPKEVLDLLKSKNSFCFNDIFVFEKYNYHSKKLISDYCEICKKQYSISIGRCLARKKVENLCVKCYYRKNVYDNPEWRKNNSKAQSIAQNNPVTKAKNAKSVSKFWAAHPETKKIVSDKIIKLFNESEEYRASTIGSRNRGYFYSKRFGRIRFESLLELAFIIKCEKNQEIKKLTRWPFNGIEYNDPKEDGKIRRYYPDFILNENTIIETKSGFILNKQQDVFSVKVEALKKAYPNMEFKLLDSPDVYCDEEENLTFKKIAKMGFHIKFFVKDKEKQYKKIRNKHAIKK